MNEKENLKPNSEFHEKLFDLFEQFNHYVFAHPDVLNNLPGKAALVLLDAEDEEFNRANIKIAQTAPMPEKDVPLVYILMKKQVRMVEQIEWIPVVVPPPLAA